MNHIYEKHTGQNIDRIHRDMERDFFMTADEAKDYGIVDEIITYTISSADKD